MNKFKKLFNSIILFIFVTTYAVPAGLCATSLPPLPKGVQSSSAHKSPANAVNIKSGEVVLSKENPLITLSLRNSDAMQVIRMFADKAGMNVIFHSSVEENTPTVTMDLVKVPLNNAFRMVLQVADLTYFIQDNTIVVLTTEAAKTSSMGRNNLGVIPVTYLDASKLANFLNKNIFNAGQPGLSNANIAVTNTERNEILLFGTDSDYQVAKRIVEKFDVKPNEGTFVVNHTTPKEMSEMICQVLFKDLAKKQDDDAVVVEDSDNSDDDDDDDDDNDSNEDKAKKVKIGKGKIACQFRPVAGENGGNDELMSLDSGGLTIVYYAERGTIYARGGTKAQMNQIKDFIAENDRRQFQAYLEMSILELNESGSREFSNTWNIYSSFFTGGFSQSLSNMAPIYLNGDSIPDMYQDPEKPILAKYTGAPVVTYAMNYLIQNGKGRVLANPKIVITSGKKSTIEITSSYIKKVTSQVMDTVASASGAVQRTYDIGNDLGISVEINPYISPDGYVTMNIIPTYSTIKEQVTQPRIVVTSDVLGTYETVNDLVATLIDKRELKLNNLRIKDGETMVIGGMLKETETKKIYKFPLLGDIPIIGMLFRSTTSSKEKNELVIMLTPRIIQESIEDTKERVML